jgi:hypothetical protein
MLRQQQWRGINAKAVAVAVIAAVMQWALAQRQLLYYQ